MAFITFEVVVDVLSEDIKDVVEQVLADNNKIATGRTLDSTEVELVSTSRGFEFNTSIGEGAPYIVQGRKAGSLPPPAGPISEWMAAKGISYDIDDVRFAIATKGIPPVDIETPILEGITQVFQGNTFTNSIQDKIEKGLNLIFTK